MIDLAGDPSEMNRADSHFGQGSRFADVQQFVA